MQDGYTGLNGRPHGTQGLAASAYATPARLPPSRSLWKVWLVAADCCLIGLQPVLVHLSKDAKETYSYHPISVNILVEVVRLCFALTMLAIYGRQGAQPYSSLAAFARGLRQNRALIVPAGLYSLNNYLKFMMQLYFKPTTAKMLANLKVLVIAVLMKYILRRHFSVLQWEALLLLSIGITTNQLDHCMQGGMSVPAAAVFYTVASLIVPSLASIFNEWALKRHMDTSVHVQNLYLYCFGLCFNTVGLLLVVSTSGRSLGSVFQGHSRFTLMLVINSACQGILSSFFFKYADTILKKYSSTIATIVTALLSALLFGHHLTLNFLLAVITVFCSMHIFFGQGGLKKRAGEGSTSSEKFKDSSLGQDSKMRGSAESLAALEADLADPDNLHLTAPRKPPLLPR